MIDFGLDKLTLIGVVALIVIGPERLPRVARTVGNLMGRAQRYMADVKAEVNRSMELDELRKMKTEVETAATQAQQQFRSEVGEVERQWSDLRTAEDMVPASDSLSAGADWSAAALDSSASEIPAWSTPLEPYASGPGTGRKSRAAWRARRWAVPAWYRQRHGLRGQLSRTSSERLSRGRNGPV